MAVADLEDQPANTQMLKGACDFSSGRYISVESGIMIYVYSSPLWLNIILIGFGISLFH